MCQPFLEVQRTRKWFFPPTSYNTKPHDVLCRGGHLARRKNKSASTAKVKSTQNNMASGSSPNNEIIWKYNSFGRVYGNGKPKLGFVLIRINLKKMKRNVVVQREKIEGNKSLLFPINLFPSSKTYFFPFFPMNFKWIQWCECQGDVLHHFWKLKDWPLCSSHQMFDRSCHHKGNSEPEGHLKTQQNSLWSSQNKVASGITRCMTTNTSSEVDFSWSAGAWRLSQGWGGWNMKRRGKWLQIQSSFQTQAVSPFPENLKNNAPSTVWLVFQTEDWGD